MTRSVVLDTLKVAATFAGAILGAGFASGQELMQFFVSYGNVAPAAILLAGLLFAWIGGLIIEWSRRLNAAGYHQLIRRLCGPRAGLLLELFIAAFLFAVFAVMLAGVGTICRDRLHYPFMLGAAILGLLVAVTAMRGIDGISAVNLVTTPSMAAIIVFVSSYALSQQLHGPGLAANAPSPQAMPAPHWLIACLQYVSYNLVISMSVLVPLGAKTASPRARKIGSLLGGLLLTALALLIALTVMTQRPAIFDREIPMLQIACQQPPLSAALYTTVLVTSMFTAATAALYGCAARLAAAVGRGRRLCVAVLALAGLWCCQFGFRALIAALFPIFGYASFYILFQLIRAKR